MVVRARVPRYAYNQYGDQQMIWSIGFFVVIVGAAALALFFAQGNE